MADRNVNGDDPRSLHIVMFPWLAYGHIMPFLGVSILLAEKGHRVSFLSTPRNLRGLPSHVPPRLSHLINFIELPFPRVDGLPDSVESTSQIPLHLGHYLKKAIDLLRTSVTEFLSNSDRTDWIIQDFPAHWMPEVASRLEIDLATFLIFNATSTAFFGIGSTLSCRANIPSPEELSTTPPWMDYQTGVRFQLHELRFQLGMDHDSNWNRLTKALRGTKFLAVRSCREFEPDANRVLDQIYDFPTVPLGLLHPKVVMNPMAGATDDGGGDDERWLMLKNWLDGKEEKSVMYVAFGSEVTFKQEMMRELAAGIDKSGSNFVWALRDRDSIPADYDVRVSGRGFVWSGWVPQVEVLSHPSVGGFMTHCGWSSVVEGLGLGRALVLLSGASADMGLTARLMHERRFGVEIPRDEEDGSFTSDDVAETIRRVMVEEEGEEIRANAWAAREVFGSAEVQDRCFDELNRALMLMGSNRFEG